MLTGLRKLLSIPDADKYSDEQYERLVIQARLRRGDAIWVLPLAAGILAAGAWIGVPVLLGYVLNQSLAGKVAPMNFGNYSWLALNGVVMVTLFLAASIGVRWMMIVRSIRNIVNKAGCPFCEFSLVGLSVTMGKVKCPECGSDVFLHEHRLTVDDLIPESQKNAPLAGPGPMGAYQQPQPSKRPTSPKAASRR